MAIIIIYLLCPKSLNNIINKLMKSKYKVNAPITAFLPINSPLSDTAYMFLIFCVSYAVKPTNTKTPIIDIAKYIIDDLRNMFTTDAIIIPIKPIIKKDPILVKSLFVV